MFEVVIDWVSQNSTRGIGALISVFSLVLLISELRVYLKYKSSVEQLILWLSALVAGLLTLIFNDILLGVLSGITFLMIYQVYELRDAPVWGKLMVASLFAYLTILGGKVAQMIYNYVTGSPPENEQIFASAFIVSVYIFFIVAFIFFGKQFILVSRLSSPQMVYLFLFAIIYGGVASMDFKNLYYLPINKGIADRILFASFGIYEILIIAMTFMYFISGWLLDVLFGVKKVTDPDVLAKVQEVADKMGIKEELKVGFVQAPILNAFAYGPFIDKRISFIASDLNQFSDSDIRGVVGHELAHATKNHTLILLLISVLEVLSKKALLLPATYFDYAFNSSGLTVSLLWYFIINYGLVIVLYIFVRALEGHADKVTKDVGYGEDLGKALFRLEGFYQGVASDFGISVNLLTNKQYTQAEREKFTAAAGRRIYQEFLSPTRSQAFSNILVSHPRTSYRITALIRDDLSPMKAAFLPYNILGLFKRKTSIEMIHQVRHDAKKLLDETFIADYSPDAIKEVAKFNPLNEYYDHLIGKNVLAYDPLNKVVEEGEVERLELTNSVSTPVKAIINGKEFLIGDYSLKEYSTETFILKHGELFTPESYKLDDKKGLVISGNIDGKQGEVSFENMGIPVSFLKDREGKKIFFYHHGSAVLGTVKKFDVEESWEDGLIVIDTPEGEMEFNTNELVYDFKPMGIQFRRIKSPEQLDLLKFNIDKKVSIYTKENYDVPLDGILRSVTEETIEIENRDGLQKFDMKLLEFVTLYENTFMLYLKDKLSFFDKFGLWWANRKKFVNIN